MKELSIDAFFSYRFLSQLNWSPEGTAAAVVVSQCDVQKNGYTAELWLYQEGTLRRLSGEAEEGYFWEDDTHILLPKTERKENVSTHFRRLDTLTGEDSPAFTLPFSIAGMKKLREGIWLVVGVEWPAPAPEDQGSTCQVLTEIPFYANNKGFIDQRRLRLYVFQDRQGTLTPCGRRFCDVREIVVDGDAVYFLGSQKAEMRTKDPRNYYEGDVYRLDWRTYEVRRLTGGGWYFSNLQKLGERLIAAADTAVFDKIPGEGNFYAVDTASGQMTLFAENGGALGNSVTTDCRYGGGHVTRGGGEELYFTKTVGSAVGLYCLREDGTTVPLLEKEGTVDDFDVSPSGEILLVGLYGLCLQELYRLEEGKIHRCGDFNSRILQGVYVADCHRLTVSSQGWDIDGWVLFPKDYDEKKRYPAILNIHGGPRNAFGEVFYHEMQYWASRGYFVFFCNPAGGSGRGQAFADIRGRYGDIDYQNVMDFTDAVLEEYPQIDRARVGCTGGSYGGFMCNWIIGHTRRFAAAATQRSISNWVSMCGVSDIGMWFPKSQMGVDRFTKEGVEELWRRSPLAYAAQMETPTLLIHSDEDYNCPLEQGIQLFTALKERNVPARMCLFRGENHELSRSGKPLNRLRRLREITAWMDRYIGESREEGEAPS